MCLAGFFWSAAARRGSTELAEVRFFSLRLDGTRGSKTTSTPSDHALRRVEPRRTKAASSRRTCMIREMEEMASWITSRRRRFSFCSFFFWPRVWICGERRKDFPSAGPCGRKRQGAEASAALVLQKPVSEMLPRSLPMCSTRRPDTIVGTDPDGQEWLGGHTIPSRPEGLTKGTLP